MPLTDTAKNLMLDELASVAVWVSLHDGDPGATGVNELSGGDPAYARKQITWPAASGGSLDDSTDGLEFDVPAGSDVTHAGFWSAATDGTFYASDDVSDPESFTGQGTYTLSDAVLSLPDPA